MAVILHDEKSIHKADVEKSAIENIRVSINSGSPQNRKVGVSQIDRVLFRGRLIAVILKKCIDRWQENGCLDF